MDDFGAPRPGHIHAGVDIQAGTGTPIVAPFPGNAVSTYDPGGGNGVFVYGSQGYVYNAHLSRYGTLGHVGTGTVIGYVGSTGDATGPHDHFEWHPNVIPANPYVSPYGYSVVGTAIDAYPYLNSVC
jgi:murein DD-endopeptidase MepM/ murein hydrolase activator NlpD